MFRELSANPVGCEILVVLRALVLLAALALPVASAQSTDEPKSGQADIQEALRTGRSLMEVDILVSTTGAQAQGEKDAKVTIVEFFDYECPYCGVHADLALSHVLDEYVKTGKLRYVFRNFPVEQHHPLAEKAAEAAECAAEQGKFWEAHVRLLKNQMALHPGEFGLDETKFQECLASGRSAMKVKKDLAEGKKYGVTGTPAFFFGYPDLDDRSNVRAVKLLIGSRPFSVFKDVIDSLLNSPKEKGDER